MDIGFDAWRKLGVSSKPKERNERLLYQRVTFAESKVCTRRPAATGEQESVKKGKEDRKRAWGGYIGLGERQRRSHLFSGAGVFLVLSLVHIVSNQRSGLQRFKPAPADLFFLANQSLLVPGGLLLQPKQPDRINPNNIIAQNSEPHLKVNLHTHCCEQHFRVTRLVGCGDTVAARNRPVVATYCTSNLRIRALGMGNVVWPQSRFRTTMAALFDLSGRHG